MSVEQDFPTLFGRFTTVLRDHNELKTTLRQLLDLCAALESGKSSLLDGVTPAQLVRELQRKLSEHFAAEESERYFGVVEAEEPALSPQIRQLRVEHQKMLEMALALSTFAADPTCWAQLAPPLRTLIARFQLHEHAESALLNRLFRPRFARTS